MSLILTRRADQQIAPHRFLGAGRWEMGCHDRAGAVAPESLLHRAYRPGQRFCLGVAAAPAGPVQLHLPRALYGGMLVDHFGHFVTETLARLWPAETEPDLPLILTLPQRIREPRLERWQAEILELLGLRDRVLPLTRPVQVQDCLIPEPGYEIQFAFAPEHARFLGRVAWQPRRGCWLWLSRAGLAGRGGDGPGQSAIDSAMSRAGWQVVHPETLSVNAQLAAYAQAERIAGEEGSALIDSQAERLSIMVRT